MIHSVFLCTLEELPEQGARGFDVSWDGRVIPLIVLRENERVRGYLNSCPHTGVRLEWRADDFFDAEGQHLQCTTHDARFRPEDGHCIAGPCRGQALVAALLEERDGQIHLLDPHILPRSARRR
jgi:nitrite reductase/ring-hydroxylating ferredoxin subunit